jgi:hypothetical protein
MTTFELERVQAEEQTLGVRLDGPALIGVFSVIGLLALELYARFVDYGLRVTSDAPTFLALLRDLAIDPGAQASPFLPGQVETAHATPYMQALAWLWSDLADRGGLIDPVGAYGALAFAGLAITVLVLHAFYVWARAQSGRRAAWLALPVLFLLFGPAHVIWAGDLSFHGFMYASFYPQTVALGLLLYTLVALDAKPGLGRAAGLTALIGVTISIHPFTGALLAGLIALDGSLRAVRRDRRWMGASGALVAGFLVAEAWPAYSVDRALAVVGPHGVLLIASCAALPVVVMVAARAGARVPKVGLLDALRRRRTLVTWTLALTGLGLVVGLALWQAYLLAQPNPDPLIPTNRLALYWVEDRWRWPLMLGAGAIGLVGLDRLARRGRPLPALWFGSCAAIAVAGLAGVPIPVWWRFLLFCQLPLALGVAEFLVRSRGAIRVTVVATFAFALAFKAATLFGMPERITYFGNELQPAYRLGHTIPPGPQLVATDPFTAYYVPAATGHRVLTVTKAHVGSDAELTASAAGYRLLHQFYMGDSWWKAGQQMWRRGVRWIVVEHNTSLEPPTLVAFSTGPTPLIRTEEQRRQIGTYFYRLNRLGTLVSDSPTYAIYRLDKWKLWS